MRLTGKSAIVTGAGSGMGRAIAVRFAREGAQLVLNDVRTELLGATLAMLDGVGHGGVPGDVALETTAEALVAAAVERLGRCDILVNNAGMFAARDVTDVTVGQWERMVAVNVTSMILCCKHVIPVMLRQGSGAIINLASTAAGTGSEILGRSTFEYSMTKAAAYQLTISLATRYAREGIRVNAICPGMIATNMMDHMEEPFERDVTALDHDYYERTPMQRAADPSEVAGAAVFLASDDASFVTGHGLAVDGGFLAR